MAARKRTTLSASWKEKIQATQILNRLLGHFNGTVEMSNTQIKAADIILKKVLPDLAKTELTGEDGGPIKTETNLPETDRDIINRYLQQKEPA
jgi:hypothetical protein